MDPLTYLVAFFCIGLCIIFDKLRARKVEGVPCSRSFEFFFGTTRHQARTVLKEKKMTWAQYYQNELEQHNFTAFGWGRLGGKRGIVVCQPNDTKSILKTQFANFTKGQNFREVFQDITGDGIFNTNGDKWKEQRITMAHMFNRRQLRDRMSTTFGNHAQDMVQILQDAASSSDPYNIQELFYCYTFDCINMIAFNRDVNSLKGVERDCAFQAAFDTAQQRVIHRFILPWWKISEKYGLSEDERMLKKALNNINQYVEQVVDGYYDEEGNIRDDALQGDQTMTGLFLEAAKEEGKKYDRKFLRDMILNTVIAGRDTTGSALTSCVEYLVQHPEWQDKLAEEAKTCFGGNTQEALTFDDIEGKSPVAEAVFLEALRLNPSVPSNEKIAVKDVTLPSGVEVKKDAIVGWLPMATSRYKGYWGEDAEEFNPTRWMKGKAYDDYMYPTFNAGPRLCLGKNMAILEGKTALLTIFAHFRFTAKKGFKPTHIASVTWQNDHNGMQVHVNEI
eukprot:TRINITY_DN479_c0_g2_i11.p1 TRINITY_DN479_c0_g2~~TRINITY_DN479_c0_g2_i11.p1  ORF type:complete len:516 (+),score=149.29 TRINITY_DN479_c0_g2_i11:35-1549(+)